MLSLTSLQELAELEDMVRLQYNDLGSTVITSLWEQDSPEGGALASDRHWINLMEILQKRWRLMRYIALLPTVLLVSMYCPLPND